MLQIPTDIPMTHDDLLVAVRLRGGLNNRALTIDGEDYPPCSLVYLGFTGNANGNGHHCFREAQTRDEDNDVIRISRIPHFNEDFYGRPDKGRDLQSTETATA